MHGDYSRGHEPDRKRGRSYRRVLLQQGRPVLDSDVAATVDAQLGELRAATRALGCSAGSSDLGFLVTPGHLLAIFTLAHEGLAVTSGTPDAWIDYRHRYAGRYPALYVAGAGSVTVPLLAPASPSGGSRLALWARVEAPTTITVNGVAVALNSLSPDVPQRAEIDLGGTPLEPFEVEVGAGEQVWLFLLEQDQDAGIEPVFWVAPGSYQLDGLVVDARGGGAFPDVSFPEASGFPWIASPSAVPPLDGLLAPAGLAAGTRLVAYLEAHERHMTHVEDPGIREQALGAYDTSARTELIGQVKLATLTGTFPGAPDAAARAVRAAFADVAASAGELTIDVPQATPSTDPCDLPDVAGYSGADNRLYRVEVHRGGGLSQVRLKWSRDNGSELFAARLDDDSNLVFDAGTPLAAGDLVEVLSHVVDLGDDALGQVGPGAFEPPRRAVGQLAQLAAVPSDGSTDEVAFSLVDPDDITTPVELDLERYGEPAEAALKLRRWHGILDPQQIAGGGAASPGPHVLEDAVTVELSSTGSYRPGQWWQYEARVVRENANGPWRPQPHGPERRFAPLALLEHQGAGQPLLLLEWLDERFSPLCRVGADDVAFAGERVGSASDTVQEALEELFERGPVIVESSCGEIIVPPGGDLQAAFDLIPEFGSARLCIHPGTWELADTVVVENKGDLVISGAGSATRLTGELNTVLRFDSCGRVRVHDLQIDGGRVAATGDGLAGSLALLSSRGLDLERVTLSCGAATTRRVSAVEVRTGGPPFHIPEVRVRDCFVTVGNAQVGLLLVNAAHVDIEDNTIISHQDEWPLAQALEDPAIAGRVRRLLLHELVIGETDEANDELLVGSPNVVVEVTPSAHRRRFVVHLDAWGAEFITFSTALGLSSETWRAVFEANPIPGDWRGQPAPAGFLLSRLRGLRRGLVGAMFSTEPVAIVPGAAQGELDALAVAIRQRNFLTAGGQGIVLAGRGTDIDTDFPEPTVLLGNTRPDAHIAGNRVIGFVQGIHVGTSRGHRRGVSHRVTIADNEVQLRVPTLAGERHGIFVGSVFHARVRGNAVVLRFPDPSDWPAVAPLDGIRVHGTLGPLVHVRENTCIGTTNGVVAHATNAGQASAPGWRWAVADNAHVGPPGGLAEDFNW